MTFSSTKTRMFLGLAATALLANCSPPQGVDSTAAAGDAATVAGDRTSWDGQFAITELDTVDDPWAARFVPGTSVLVATMQKGGFEAWNVETGQSITISGAPTVDYGGQGGLGDIAFLESEAGRPLSGRTVYLSWVEAGDGDTRGAVVGRGKMNCASATRCSIDGLNVIWRQSPKVTGRGHFSHRIAFAPDESVMYIASGERQKMAPAQDTSNTLGTIVRLNLDGTPAAGNPLASRGGPSAEIFSWGHRNILGLSFNEAGQLWEVEHGPKGGDELNLVRQGANYGWPVRSNGIHYDGAPIADHSADDGFAKPAVSWSPVIAPGDMVFYSGDLFGGMDGDLIITGLSSKALIRVAIDGDTAREVARYPMKSRIRTIAEGPDGALYAIEDGENARVLKLTPG